MRFVELGHLLHRAIQADAQQLSLRRSPHQYRTVWLRQDRPGLVRTEIGQLSHGGTGGQDTIVGQARAAAFARGQIVVAIKHRVLRFGRPGGQRKCEKKSEAPEETHPPSMRFSVSCDNRALALALA